MIKVNPYRVLAIARNVQFSEHEPCFILGTRDYPLKRGFYAVYIFQYADGLKYAVQLPIFMPSSTEEEREAISTTIEKEIFTLAYLKDRGFSWSPRPITYSIQFDNPVKFPYMLLSWIAGKPMQWNDEIPASLDVRENVSKQLAHIMIDLALATEQHHTGISAVRFLLNLADSRTLGVIRARMPGVNLKECMQLRKLIREAFDIPNEVYSYPGECLEGCTHGPKVVNCLKVLNRQCSATQFCLSHEEVTAENIIVDDNYRIQGLINWSYARNLPARISLRLPAIFSIESTRLQDTAEDDARLTAKYLSPSPILHTDRENYSHHMSSTLIDKAPGQELAECAPMATDTFDLDWKHLIMLAAFSTRTHWWLAQRNFLLNGTFVNMTGRLLHQERGWDHDVSLEGYHFAEDNLENYGTGARKSVALANFKRSKGGIAMEWDYVDRWLRGHFRERQGADNERLKKKS